MFPVTVTPGHVIQVRGGAVHHDDLVRKPYGSKVRDMNYKLLLMCMYMLCSLFLSGDHF